MGRYKYNKKLNLATRLKGNKLAEDIVNVETGEILAEAGEYLDADRAADIENAGIKEAWVYDTHFEETKVKVIGNHFVDINAYVKFDLSDTKVADKVYYPALQEVLAEKQRCE